VHALVLRFLEELVNKTSVPFHKPERVEMADGAWEEKRDEFSTCGAGWIWTGRSRIDIPATIPGIAAVVSRKRIRRSHCLSSM
jgi:hypothetical protein